MKTSIRLLVAVLALGLFTSAALACGPACKSHGSHGAGGHGSHGTVALAAAEGEAAPAAEATKTVAAPAYPIDYCLVSGEKLGTMGDPVVKTYDGREVQFCCNGCVKKFEANQADYLKKLDAAVVEAQKVGYPLETCVVSGEKLGGMGEPVDYVYQNRLVRFCCAGCIPAFNKDPQKYLAMLDGGSAPQSEGHESHQH